MKFDWQRFCEAYGVNFVTVGANVSHGNINIRCPFCNDPSEHLGLSLNASKPSWGCWRCKQGGLNPQYLLRKLLGSKELVTRALEEQRDRRIDDFDNLFDEAEKQPPAKRRTEKQLPAGLRPLDPSKPLARAASNYLLGRGFESIEDLAQAYDLHYGLTGEYAGRIMLPVYFEGRLVSWAGRAYAQAKLRYKTEDSGDLKRLVANYDELLESKGLVVAVTEGPMDFLKVDFFGKELGLRATCTFGTRYTEAQLVLLRRLSRRHRLAVLFDPEASIEGLTFSTELSEVTGKRVDSIDVGDLAEDPGALTKQQVRKLARTLT